MASQLEIYNKALSRIGAGRVRVETEKSQARIECDSAWVELHEGVLRAHDWNFARHTIAGVALSGTPLQTRWAYEHKYPSNCMFVRYIYTDTPDDPHEHEIALSTDDPTVKAIYSNVESPLIVYTRRVDHTYMWDPSFTNAVAWKLASEIAIPLTQSEKRAQLALQGYFAAIQVARAENIREGKWDILGSDAVDPLTASRA
ncbi:hypothetical protein N9468_04615 [Flavobacteriaceae bacterium]|nr:hypothetical protein [Flavobacteriaceae bacterium]